MPRQTEPFTVGDQEIAPGERRSLAIPVGYLSSHEPFEIRLEVIHGRMTGPRVFVCSCLHGDETNSAEIARRLLRLNSLKKLRGTLIVAPILNIPAFTNRSRYLPDRRDLNRLFPGSAKGSLGSRLANLVCEEILKQTDVVIDLHTGAVNRPNLPQVRVTAGDLRSRELGEVFGAPVVLESDVRMQSLRATCTDLSLPIIIFEGGEALRMDSASIRFGVRGITAVLRHLSALPGRRRNSTSARLLPHFCNKSSWERAPKGGLFTPLAPLGKIVNKGAQLGFIADPYNGTEYPVLATTAGIVVGRTNEGIADEGDALYHIANSEDLDAAKGSLQSSARLINRLTEDDDDHPVPYHPFTHGV